MKTFFAIASAISLPVVAVTLHSLQQQAQAFPTPPENCVYLREVTTGNPIIRKVVAINNSNANTDFAVPTGRRFTSYIGRLIPENNSRFTAEANLKYNDGTFSTAVTRTIEARRFFLYNQPFRAPIDQQPFQINARVTGARNTAYQVAVLACEE